MYTSKFHTLIDESGLSESLRERITNYANGTHDVKGEPSKSGVTAHQRVQRAGNSRAGILSDIGDFTRLPEFAHEFQGLVAFQKQVSRHRFDRDEVSELAKVNEDAPDTRKKLMKALDEMGAQYSKRDNFDTLKDKYEDALKATA